VNLKGTFQLQISIDQKQLENVEYFRYLGSMIRNDARYTYDSKCRTFMAKATFDSKLDINLKKKLVKSCIWNIALHDDKNLTLLKVDKNTWKV
jgi:hypothetical protein